MQRNLQTSRSHVSGVPARHRSVRPAAACVPASTVSTTAEDQTPKMVRCCILAGDV